MPSAATNRTTLVCRASAAERSRLKSELLSLCHPTEMGYASTPQQDKEIDTLMRALEGHNPTARPVDHLDTLCRSWRLVYSNLPALYQKVNFLTRQKPSRHEQNLELLSFCVLPPQNAELKSLYQVVRPDGAYSMVMDIAKDSIHGQVLARGSYEFKQPDKRPDRLLATFKQIAMHFDGNADDVQRFRDALQVPEGAANERCIDLANRPAATSDVTYLDGDVRIARAGMGSYVMVADEDRFGDSVNVADAADSSMRGEVSTMVFRRLANAFGRRK